MTAASLTIGGGRIVTPGGVLDGRLTISGGIVAAIDDRRRPSHGAHDVDAAGGWVVPGFIDAQVNGGHGIDVTTEPHRVDELGAHLPRYGVTAFVPTIVSCPSSARAAALAAWRRRRPAPHGEPQRAAVPLGLHLEGPMLAPARRGAHRAEHLRPPDPALIAGWSRAAGVVMVTLAPELPGSTDVIAALVARGVVVSIGHTDGGVADIDAAVAAGARGVTHLFNAMRPFGHRDPGPVGAVLAGDALVAGLIVDGVHVDPVAVRLAWRALGPARLMVVSDAVAALGVTAAATTLAGGAIVRDGAAVRDAAGVLAGAATGLDQALRNLVAFTGCSVEDAVRTVTATPAALLGCTDRGRLDVGARGDVVVLDRELRVRTTVIAGEVAWPPPR